jgi:hypothetical protein
MFLQNFLCTVVQHMYMFDVKFMMMVAISGN